jgi:hypothetical protein
VTIIHPPTPPTGGDLPVLDAELVPLAEVLPRPLRYPPAIPASLVLTTCRCGNVTERGHGAVGDRRAFTCDEVRAIRRRVEAHAAQPRRAARRLFRRIRGGAA